MATIPNVDVVVGGDSHTLLGSAGPFAGTGIFSPLGPYATMVGNVCVVQAWEYGKVVGKLDILFDTNGNVTRCVGQPNLPINADQDANNTYQVLGPGFPATLFLNTTDKALLTAWLLGKGIFANVTADPVVTAAVKPFKDASAAAGGRVVGSANTSICHTTFNDDVVCPNRPLTNCLGGGVCNLVARGFLFNVPTADFAIQNAGGCRTDILAGNITFSNLVTILPFSNTLVTMQMTGQEIKNAMEDAANFFLGLGGGPGSYPFAAGLRWQVDYNAAFGSRFTNIEMNPKLAGVWAPLNLTRSYGVVTNSFIGTGRDGYFAFNASTVQATFVNTFVEYAQVRTIQGMICTRDDTCCLTFFNPLLLHQSFINYVSSINGPLNEPPLGNFSSQRMRFLTQRVCDVSLNVTFPSPVAPPVAPAAPTAPVVAPAVAPVAPKATTKAPTKIPTQAPVKPKRCGLLKLSVFCPLTQCGLIGKWLGLCNND